VDALSHALIAYILFSATGLTPIIPFCILGAVILDVDIFFPLIFDRDPSLYLFTHGGIAHSFLGALVLSLLAYLAIMLVALASIIPQLVVSGFGVYGIAAILAGALLHLAIDVAACPGIPLFAPVIDRKYTPALLPGPSVLLMGSAIGLLIPAASGLVPFTVSLAIYAVIVVMYLAVRLGVFLYTAATVRGWRIPTINPFRWLVINEDDNTFTVRYYTLFSGFSEGRVFEKYRNISKKETEQYLDVPEVKKLNFHSYIVTAERTSSTVIFTDPLRENRYIYYPPKYKQVTVPVAGGQKGTLI